MAKNLLEQLRTITVVVTDTGDIQISPAEMGRGLGGVLLSVTSKQ